MRSARCGGPPQAYVSQARPLVPPNAKQPFRYPGAALAPAGKEPGTVLEAGASLTSEVNRSVKGEWCMHDLVLHILWQRGTCRYLARKLEFAETAGEGNCAVDGYLVSDTRQ